MTATLLRAAWVVPIDKPAIAGGAVRVDGGRITAVGPAADLLRAAPPAAVHDFGDAAILPGLVNPHTHLDLSHFTPPPRPGRFIDWIASVIASAGDAPAAAASASAGITESLRFGVTTVGDVTRHPAATRPAFAGSGLRAVSFGEVVGMAGRKLLLAPRLAAALENTPSLPHLFRAISPHAPYSVAPEGYLQCIAAALEHDLPLTTHLAETADEATFLSHHAGPFRELWDRLGAWEENPFPRFPGTPIEYAQSLGLLSHHPCALAHVNYCTERDLELLAAGRASVVYCPRTHAYFNHPPHRWREMLAAGVNVAAGTDSRASSPNLNPVDDLRLLHCLAPEVPSQTLWEMATIRAARALGQDAAVGSLTPGKSADFAVFPTTSTDPLTEILESPTLPTQVWSAGAPVSPR